MVVPFSRKRSGAKMKTKTTIIIIVLLLSVGCTYKKGRISLQSDPPGAEVYVGGAKVGETPTTFDYLCCYLKELKIVKDGYEPRRETLSKLWIKQEARRGGYGETRLVMDGKERKVWTVTTRRVLAKKGETPGYPSEATSSKETGTAGMASVKYDPATTIMIDKNLGQNITVGILNIPDRRHDAEGKEHMIGTIYLGTGITAPPKIPIKRIYSEHPINLDVMDALANLFSANGFQVKTYPGAVECDDLSDERLCVKGQISHFWTEAFNRTGAVVDIDVEVWDRDTHEAIWSGKISDVQKKYGAGLYAVISTDRMVLLLNQVFSEAVNTAWTIGGMREALEEWTIGEIREHQSQTVERRAVNPE